METVIIQLWEESHKNGTISSDGCSLHTDIKNKDNYVNSFYKEREYNIPDTYERIVGSPTSVLITDAISNILKEEKNIRLSEIELNNLVGLKERLPI